MKTTTSFSLSQQELLDLISGAIGHPINPESVRWKIKRSGDVDRGTYRETIEGVTVTIDLNLKGDTSKPLGRFKSVCTECKREFMGRRNQKFCTTPCKVIHNNEIARKKKLGFSAPGFAPVDISKTGKMICRICKNEVERLSSNSCKCKKCGYSLNFYIVK